ncbi:MAG TPA: coagulation factor 5/8 type domain-containing protein [Polyangiaceae bacterium]|jgi:hypothetical protein
MRTGSFLVLAVALSHAALGCDPPGGAAPDTPAGDASTTPPSAPASDAAASPPDSTAPASDASSPPAPGTDAGAMPAEGGSPLPGWPATDAAALSPPDFGPNVLVFDPSMSTATIQSKLDTVSNAQNAPTPMTPVGFGYGAEFSTSRYALLFKPGQYDADVKLGFYVQALGLGHSPDDVTIKGAVRVKADWRTDDPGDALLNFWRGAENLAVVPSLAEDSNTEVWAVSQATHLRRVHIEGPVALSDGGWSSGGFIADSKIDTSITSGTQQQFFTRNTQLTSWTGGSWNMVFVGDQSAPTGSWPSSPYTVVDKTPAIREKPFLFVEPNGDYYVMVPALKTASQGPSWASPAAPGTSIPIGDFYIASAGADTAATLNAALAKGKHLLLTPGIYHLEAPIQVTKPDVVVLGLGLATLVPDDGTPALTVADVDGATIAGLLFDANTTSSPTLLQIGDPGSTNDHSKDPTALFDVHCRVGGPIPGTASSCITIHSNDVLLDHSWLWRSDDGAGVGWTQNMSDTGLIVNGRRVKAYGLFVEHFQKFQTMWNGDDGTLYFYQSELPYDPPDQASWSHDGVNGYASYKVADSVTTHAAAGLGVYCVFDSKLVAYDAVETKAASAVTVNHAVLARFGGASGSGIDSIINGTGGGVNDNTMSARTPN